MNHGFNFDKVQSVEFGVCCDTQGGERYWQIPVGRDVQAALKEMLEATFASLAPDRGDMDQYEPAQKYSSTERLIATNAEGILSKLEELHRCENLDVNPGAMRETSALAYYFATYRDDKRQKVIGVRRATQFKGVIKARNRLIALVDDSLELVPDNVFKLDTDFDYVVFETKVWILRPTGFEYTAGIESEIAAKALAFVDEVAASIPSVDLGMIKPFVQKHKRAARLIASLRARNDLHLTSASKLKRGCKTNGIETIIKGKKLFPKEGHELAFLELLDRRRYTVELIDDNEEFYVAPNRRGLPKASP